MEDERVRELAETLKRNNLAASMSEAIEKARSILNVDTAKSDTPQNKVENPDLDLKDENHSLNELMGEVNVTSEQVEKQEQKQLEHIRTEINRMRGSIKHAGEHPENVERLRRKIEKLKNDAKRIIEIKATESPKNENQPKQKDMFEQERNVDLSKIFNKKKQSP